MIVYEPIPILFELGKIKIYSYGLMLALAFVVCFLFLRKLAEKRMKKHIENIFILSTIAALIGARIGYVILNFNNFSTWTDMLRIWQGGLMSYTGILGGVIAALIYVHIKKLDLLKILDLFAPFIALGFAIGRIGCFLNWCCYGQPSMFKFALWVGGIPRHATQLYLSIGNLVIFGVLLYLYYRFYKSKTSKKGNGSLFFLFLLLYSVLRFITDFLRAYPAKEYIAGLALSQWISILLLFFSLFILLRKPRNSTNKYNSRIKKRKKKK